MQLKFTKLFFVLALLSSLFSRAWAQSLISSTANWKYLVTTSEPANGWKGNVAFDDSAWPEGSGPLGFGNGSIVTTLGGSTAPVNRTTYFRKTFTVADKDAMDKLIGSLRRDDGAVVYLNGVEVIRSNMNPGTVSYSTAALGASDNGNTTYYYSIDKLPLKTGDNVLAAEVHQSSSNSSDLLFHFMLDNKLIEYAETWKYLDNGSNQGTAWRASAFDDSSWASNVAPLGYGTSINATNTLSFGSNSAAKYPTTYFRKSFTVVNPTAADAYVLSLKVDDGAVAYINGVEVGRVNMAAGTVAYNTYANATVNTDPVETNITVPASAFVAGANTIAVEVHQVTAGSSDISFDLRLAAKQSSDQNPLALASLWKYKDDGSDQNTAWRASGFNDSGWATGSAPLGYGTAGVVTAVSYGGNASAKFPTTYFRKTINIANPSQFFGYKCTLVKDDGVVIYLNGNEVFRDGVPANQDYTTFANKTTGNPETIIFGIPASAFVSGANTIAVEAHQASASSSDIYFDLQMDGVANVEVTRGPFLQMGSETGVTVCWSTNYPIVGKVNYGATVGSLGSSVSSPAASVDHEVRVSGLTADSKYFYAIGYDSQVLKSGADYFMRTSAPANTSRKVRITAYGDCGLVTSAQSNVLNAYMNYMGSNPTDVMLLLGDNAYNSGYENEYQTTFFNIYQDKLLRNTMLFPSLGNHDYANLSARMDDHDIHYLKAFALPKNGESGGVASGKEEYYSFDYGDIHFIALDSYGRENGSRFWVDGTPQMTWLKNDLAANQRKWTIAYFHHPPYTMGDHNSDTESELVNTRQSLISVLENAGVDLVLNGHSHTFERSKLIKNHYGNETSYDPATNEVSTSSGRYDGIAANAPYITTATKTQHGTVYIVAGNAGGRGNSKEASFPHEALRVYSDADTHGTLVIEVEGGRMDVKYLIDNGVIQDQFTLMKDPVTTTNITIEQGQTATLTPAFVADNYQWSNGQTTKTIDVSPVVGDYVFTVSDNVNGTSYVTDTYNVKVLPAGSLPLELLSYNAKLVKGTTELSWATASEHNVDRFDVARAGQDRVFKSIGQVAATGTTATTQRYNFVDRAPLLGVNYYRLTEYDKDGKTTELGVRSVDNSLQENALRVISASQGQLKFSVSSLVAAKAKFAIVDMSGKLLAEKEIAVVAGENSFSEPFNQSSGIYVLRLTVDSRVLTQKFNYLSK